MSTHRSSRLLVFLGMALVLILTFSLSAQSATPKSGGTLVIARRTEVVGLDPHRHPAHTSLRFFELVYNTLVRLDGDLNVAPELARSWRVSPNGMRYTFFLNPNIKFHNGQMLTSADIRASLERILDPKTGSPVRSFFIDIENIETPDDSTVVLNLHKPNAALLVNLTHPNASIVSRDVIARGALEREVIGTGPFKLVERVPDNYARFERYKDFHIPGLPRVDKLELRIVPDETSILAGLRAKTIDWAIVDDPNVVQVASRVQGLQVMAKPSLSYRLLGLNNKRKPFDDLRVRQALSLAIDRKRIVDVAALGQGQVTGPLAPALTTYALPIAEFPMYKYDPARARQLLAEAGYGRGFEFSVIYGQGYYATFPAEAQTIQALLREIGVSMRIEPVEFGTFVARWRVRDFDSFISTNSGAPDPDFILFRTFHSQGATNVFGYANPRVDALLEQGQVLTSRIARRQAYEELQKILANDAPIIWTYVANEYRIAQPYVKGFIHMANSSIVYLRETWLDK